MKERSKTTRSKSSRSRRAAKLHAQPPLAVETKTEVEAGGFDVRVVATADFAKLRAEGLPPGAEELVGIGQLAILPSQFLRQHGERILDDQFFLSQIGLLWILSLDRSLTWRRPLEGTRRAELEGMSEGELTDYLRDLHNPARASAARSELKRLKELLNPKERAPSLRDAHAAEIDRRLKEAKVPAATRHKEIAARFGIPMGAVRMALSRGRDIIKTLPE